MHFSQMGKDSESLDFLQAVRDLEHLSSSAIAVLGLRAVLR